jgi:hypothetical protein
MEFESTSAGLLSVEHWVWKSLWMCRKTDYAMNEL